MSQASRQAQGPAAEGPYTEMALKEKGLKEKGVKEKGLKEKGLKEKGLKGSDVSWAGADGCDVVGLSDTVTMLSLSTDHSETNH